MLRCWAALWHVCLLLQDGEKDETSDTEHRRSRTASDSSDKDRRRDPKYGSGPVSLLKRD